METYDKEQVKHIVDVLLDEFIADMASTDISFEDYDYGYLAGIKDFKKKMFTVMEGLELEPA
jgi:hypothetical protein